MNKFYVKKLLSTCLDSCQFLTYLHAAPPRISCPEHGVRQARLPLRALLRRSLRLSQQYSRHAAQISGSHRQH
jgi:hypothetical protein